MASQVDERRDGGRQPLPVGGFAFELAAARAGQRVELRSPIVLALLPLGGDPAVLLELVQRRIERAVADLQHVVRDLPQALADGKAVQRFEREDLQNQQVESALDEIGGFAHLLARLPSELTVYSSR